MKTVTNNEDYVRLRIYEGDLQVSGAAAELLRLEIAQGQARVRELVRHINALTAHCEKAGLPLG